MVIGNFLILDGSYRERIRTEIASLTTIIAQNMDSFFETPERYLRTIKGKFNGFSGSQLDASIEQSLLDFLILTETFESIYQLDPSGVVVNLWPQDSNILGSDFSSQRFFYDPEEGQGIYWSDTFLSLETGSPAVALSTPLGSDRLVAIFGLEALNEFLSINLSGEEEFITILDRDGNIVAHSLQDLALQSENLSNMRSVQNARQGDYRTIVDTYKGQRGLAGIYPAKHSGFSVLVFKSYDKIFSNLLTVYVTLILVMVSLLIFFGFTIFLVLKRSARALTDLQNKIAQVSQGSYDLEVHSKYREFEDFIASFKSMVKEINQRETALGEGLRIRETLLRELSHRVKNNMQVIIAMMNLYNQKEGSVTDLNYFKEIQSKIHTISLVHEKLYLSDSLSSINIEGYLKELIPSVLYSLTSEDSGIEYELKTYGGQILIDYAVPLGLVINELVTNSIKHAFTNRPSGMIRVQCTKIQEKLEIIYQDNGVGFPTTVDPHKAESIGLVIIRSIVESQLDGTLELKNDSGVYVKISIPLNLYDERLQDS